MKIVVCHILIMSKALSNGDIVNTRTKSDTRTDTEKIDDKDKICKHEMIAKYGRTEKGLLQAELISEEQKRYYWDCVCYGDVLALDNFLRAYPNFKVPLELQVPLHLQDPFNGQKSTILTAYCNGNSESFMKYLRENAGRIGLAWNAAEESQARGSVCALSIEEIEGEEGEIVNIF